MSEPTIICPECNAEIKLTKALAAPMISNIKKEFKELTAQKEAEYAQRELELEEDRGKMALRVHALVEEARKKIMEQERKTATEEANEVIRSHAMELDDAMRRLAVQDVKLAEAQKAQAEALRKERELEVSKREMQLTIDKSISEGLQSARASAVTEVEQRMHLRVREKEELIVGMQRQIEELRQKAEQGSQQLQGEVQELHLEELLKERFLADTVAPVPKGVHGGDIVQNVVSPSGRDCGTILWESKRTKTWSATWLPKLRDDQRAAKADIAVIVSQALPKDVETFDLIDGVWVCGPAVAIAMATVLRQGLLDVASAKLINEGMQTKAEEVYQYLTGPSFKRHVSAIVEAFSGMKEDLDKERKAITKQWVKREAQLERVMQATVGMYGDLSAIAGQSLQEVDGLEMKALEA